jgi:hypothetical protein
MPVTTVDIPSDLLAFIDNIIHAGSARNRREIIVRALEVFAKLDAHTWDDPIIYIGGIRGGFFSKGSVREILSGMSEEELYDLGKRMSKSLKDLSIQRHIDLSRPENHKAALQMLEDFGWGKFTIDERRITITAPFLPSAVFCGYLENALSIPLNKIETSEDMDVFERIMEVKKVELKEKQNND